MATPSVATPQKVEASEASTRPCTPEVITEDMLRSKNLVEQAELLHSTALAQLEGGMFYNAAMYLERALDVSIKSLHEGESGGNGLHKEGDSGDSGDSGGSSLLRSIVQNFASTFGKSPPELTEEERGEPAEKNESKKFVCAKDCAQTAFILGMVRMQNLGDYRGAVAPMKLALDTREEVMGKRDFSTVVTRMVLGQIYETLDRLDDAIDLLTEVAEATEELLGRNNPQTSKAYFELGRVVLRKHASLAVSEASKDRGSCTDHSDGDALISKTAGDAGPTRGSSAPASRATAAVTAAVRQEGLKYLQISLEAAKAGGSSRMALFKVVKFMLLHLVDAPDDELRMELEREYGTLHYVEQQSNFMLHEILEQAAAVAGEDGLRDQVVAGEESLADSGASQERAPLMMHAPPMQQAMR